MSIDVSPLRKERGFKFLPARSRSRNLLDNVVTGDISHPRVIEAYVELDLVSQAHPDGARNMGKNDLWIAASAKAAGATLLTTDGDFDHLFPDHLAGVVIDPKVATTNDK